MSLPETLLLARRTAVTDKKYDNNAKTWASVKGCISNMDAYVTSATANDAALADARKTHADKALKRLKDGEEEKYNCDDDPVSVLWSIPRGVSKSYR